ncbi:hypothetical protein Golob_016637 [Gossypium lobatum]|uniref:RNase H type-1 domain-containing protein n=2 Tax=Gossypium TaxID=3633 RepID=A0A7J8M4U0_9ROSI|nr:hypothetical protein [Gossypium lobatum]
MGELGGASQRWMIGWRNAQLRAAAGNASMVGVEVREIKWLPPPQGWVKINTDGAVKMTNGYAGAVVRDHHEDWLAGCSRNIGCTTVEEAEMWGIHDGLLLPWPLGVRQAILETDCLPAV